MVLQHCFSARNLLVTPWPTKLFRTPHTSSPNLSYENRLWIIYNITCCTLTVTPPIYYQTKFASINGRLKFSMEQKVWESISTLTTAHDYITVNALCYLKHQTQSFNNESDCSLLSPFIGFLHIMSKVQTFQSMLSLFEQLCKKALWISELYVKLRVCLNRKCAPRIFLKSSRFFPKIIYLCQRKWWKKDVKNK